MRPAVKYACLVSVLTLLVAPVFVSPAQGQVHLWSMKFGDPQFQWGINVTTDSADNVILTGSFWGTIDFGGGPLSSVGFDMFLAKLDANGNHGWSRRFGDPDYQYGYDVAVDGSDNVFLAGYGYGTVDFGGGPLTSAGQWDVFLSKFDSGGSHLWSRSFGDPLFQYASGVATNSSNDVLITGSMEGATDFGGGNLVSGGQEDAFVAQFNAAGVHVWSRVAGGPGVQQANAVAVDPWDDVFLAGTFENTVGFGGAALNANGTTDAFLSKLNSSTVHWELSFGGPDTAHAAEGLAVAADASGNVFLAGDFRGVIDLGGGALVTMGTNPDPHDIFLGKFDTYGNHLWSKSFGDSLVQHVTGLAVDSAGNLFLTGGFSGVVDFGGGGLASAGSADIFLAKFDPSGNHLWSSRFGGVDLDEGTSVAVDGSNNALLLSHGYFSTIDFGGGPLVTQWDVLLAKFAPLLTGAKDLTAGTLKAYPNPFRFSTRIVYDVSMEGAVRIAVFDVQGRYVATLCDEPQASGRQAVSWHGRDKAGNPVASGVYFARVATPAGVQVTRVVLAP